MAVHLASTTDIGSRAAVKAPTRHPDGTWNIKLTVAVFRPWRGSQATIASDPALNAAPRFARPRRRLGEEFDPAIAGCWCREPLPPRLARPKELEPTAPKSFGATCSEHAGAFGAALPRKNWSQRSESNRRPAVYETAALPAELRWRTLAFQPRLDIRTTFSLLQHSLNLSSSRQSLKFLPPFHAHGQHAGRRVNQPQRVLIISADQVVCRTNVIAPIAS